MADDTNAVTDDVEVALTRSIPERPTQKAQWSEWMDYCVALGGSAEILGEDTDHWDDDEEDYITVPAATKADLIELADSLGG